MGGFKNGDGAFGLENSEMIPVEEKIVDVAIPLPVGGPFSYLVPTGRMSVPKRGTRVVVPFKNRELVGYVVGEGKRDVVPAKMKPLTQHLEGEVLDEHMLELTKRMADYYCCSWGEAISNALPQLMKRPSTAKARKKLDRSHSAASDEPQRKIHVLTKEQEGAHKIISETIRARQFQPFLLHGVTASGKTEVYACCMEDALKENRSVICLVPEIALTVQVQNYFKQRFGEDVVVVHSRMTPRERCNVWESLREGRGRIVLGPRSAVFAPLRDVGLVIIDEEQEDTYKQEESPRYHALRVARWRAELENAVLLLGSATPSIGTMYEAESGRYTKLTLPERVTPHSLPSIEIVDLRGEKNPVCSRVLDRAIQDTLAQKESILLFLNRRGFSTQLRCSSCQRGARCRFCDVTLTYHQEFGAAICHYCNFRWTQLTVCPSCGGKSLQYLGLGAEKVESEIARRYPQARVARLDSDVARKRGKTEEILNAFRKHEIDILVGTQMIAKGHDFPRVTLVGILLADLALALPDFRSSERNFQILVQAAGRAGRGDRQGRVIIQTYSPDHYSITAAARNDYHAFYEAETASRKNAGYPPFSQLINVVVRGKNAGKVEQFVLALRLTLGQKMKHGTFSLIGPAPCPIPKLRGHYRWHVLLKGEDTLEMNRFLRESLQALRRTPQIYLAIDVDPVNIL